VTATGLTTLLALAALLAPTFSAGGRASGAAAGGEQPTDLKRVRSIFRAIDLDGNGEIAREEAERARIPMAAFRERDVNADAALSPDEFVMYYRQLLVDARRPVADDLLREAARIQAVRRARRITSDD
jgi:hypothetical protein